jgi:radical SAM-linked protein
MTFQRVLLRFSKEGETRFLSHHDLMRLFERAVRRADLPLRMTRGFNPHPKLSILLALPLGAEADEEPVEIELDRPVPARDVAARLNAQLPRGIRVVEASEVPAAAKPRPSGMVYRIHLPDCDCDLHAGVAAFLDHESLVVERQSPKGRRTIDLRPAVRRLGVDGTNLILELAVEQAGTPRPSEVVEAVLGAPPGPSMRLRRTQVHLAPTGPSARSAAQEQGH